MELIDFPWTLVGRTVLAGVLGICVGIERDLNGRPTGIRTSMIIAISSCLFTLMSAIGFASYPGTPDPTRIASQIVSGVGFLGAGVLIHRGGSVLGLTTAAEIWLVAAIGMAVGVGFYALAITITFLSILALVVLAPASHWLEKVGAKRMKKKGQAVIKEK